MFEPLRKENLHPYTYSKRGTSGGDSFAHNLVSAYFNQPFHASGKCTNTRDH